MATCLRKFSSNLRARSYFSQNFLTSASSPGSFLSSPPICPSTPGFGKPPSADCVGSVWMPAVPEWRPLSAPLVTLDQVLDDGHADVHGGRHNDGAAHGAVHMGRHPSHNGLGNGHYGGFNCLNGHGRFLVMACGGPAGRMCVAGAGAFAGRCDVGVGFWIVGLLCAAGLAGCDFAFGGGSGIQFPGGYPAGTRSTSPLASRCGHCTPAIFP